jgi:hypothetical protein
MKKENQSRLYRLKIEGNTLFLRHKRRYGHLRGFRKPLQGIFSDRAMEEENERVVNAFEINDYKMPR